MNGKGKPWTPADDEALRVAAGAGNSILEISNALERTEASIKARAYILRVSLKLAGKRHSFARRAGTA